MVGVAVASLDLALKLPGGLRLQASALERSTREDFIPAMLRAMERKLAAHYGEHAVIRVRRLDLKLRISAAELASPALVETVAGDFAEHLRSQAVVPGARDFAFPSEAPLVVYADPAHYAAVRLVAAAQRSPGPDGEKEALDRVWSDLRALPRATLARAVVRLFEAGRLSPVLAALPPAAARAVPRDLGSELPKPVLRAIKYDLAMLDEVQPARAQSGQAEPQVDAAAKKLVSDGQDTEPEPRTKLPGSESPGERLPTKPEPVVLDPAPISATIDDASAPENPEPVPQPVSAGQQTGNQSRSLMTGTISEPQLAPIEAVSALAPISEPKPSQPPTEPLRFASNWCGLVYLLRIALLCELPERLWQIGVDEGAALAQALGLVADEPDPVWLILSERFPDPPKPLSHVPAWALDELRDGALAAGVALLGDETALTELDAAIAAWLARLDAPNEDALCAWIAAFLLAMFGLLSEINFAGGAVTSQFARPGHMLVDGDEISVVQPLAQIDIVVRRAGLDADPGWLAWRQVTLRLAFDGEEALP